MTQIPNTATIMAIRRARPQRARIPVYVWASFVWLGVVVAMVLLQPILPLPDPAVSDYAAVRTPPFTVWGHPLGTDALGRDLLSRTVAGAGVSLSVGVGSTLIALIIGMAMGTAAGYFGGVWDRLVGWFNDILLAFPTIVALIALTTFLGPSLGTLILGMGVVAIPLVSRLARSSAMGYAQRDFVQAAKAMGSNSARILWREMVPNVMLVVMPFALTMIALAISAEGALSFLGLGVPPPQASWGGLMNEGRADLNRLPYIVFVPATAMCLTLLAISFVADWVNQRTDTRESRA
ncbi:ABC transporter permease [Glaciibacter sp. 2TAF33]|uniref:ABC transporter permease n=1 Tax=Glaciibacter sp. 2TAF33 TaxID=3233015 RepID=UPI003F8EF767